MMRHPIDTLPRQIDPWSYARQRLNCTGDLELAMTQTLKQWAKAGDKLHADIAGRLDEYSQPHLFGRIKALLSVECQRCLQPMTLNIDRAYDYVIIRDQALEERVEGSTEALICTEDELDVAWFLEEEVLLSMPMIARHEDCKAPQDLALHTAQPSADRQTPFAALKDMIKSKEQ